MHGGPWISDSITARKKIKFTLVSYLEAEHIYHSHTGYILELVRLLLAVVCGGLRVHKFVLH